MDKEINYDPYEELANAIIKQAVYDYKKALIKAKDDDIKSKNSRFKNITDFNDNISKIKRLEKFFNSEWFNILTTVDGSYIITKIKNEIKY